MSKSVADELRLKTNRVPSMTGFTGKVSTANGPRRSSARFKRSESENSMETKANDDAFQNRLRQLEEYFEPSFEHAVSSHQKDLFKLVDTYLRKSVNTFTLKTQLNKKDQKFKNYFDVLTYDLDKSKCNSTFGDLMMC